MDVNINAYQIALGAALTIGQDLVDLILHHAQQTLSPADWDALQANWEADAARAAHNAGITAGPYVDPTSGS